MVKHPPKAHEDRLTTQIKEIIAETMTPIVPRLPLALDEKGWKLDRATEAVLAIGAGPARSRPAGSCRR